MKLSEQLKQDHESGDFGKCLEGYSERAEALESDIKELVEILDESDRYDTQDSPFKVRVQAILVKHGVKL